MDMDDRVLREVVVGIGGPLRGIARETGFDITAASEVMAILCLSADLKELKERLGRIVIGYGQDGKPVFARQINAEGAMAALLKDAMRPNLVQTLEGTPALVHGGPFANIAHGTNSVIATGWRGLGRLRGDRDRFASDLGGVLTSSSGPAHPAAGRVSCGPPMGASPRRGRSRTSGREPRGGPWPRFHGIPFVVALNKFPGDTPAETDGFLELCRRKKVRAALSDVYGQGGRGGVELAEEVLKAIAEDARNFQFLYPPEMPLVGKIETIAKKVYGAAGIAMEGKVRRKILRLEEDGFGKLPVCIAKTQYSLSDDEALGDSCFTLIVTDVSLSGGAGFVVVYCGDIAMPLRLFRLRKSGY
jgi:formate--tetrahydrofolate ligase